MYKGRSKFIAKLSLSSHVNVKKLANISDRHIWSAIRQGRCCSFPKEKVGFKF